MTRWFLLLVVTYSVAGCGPALPEATRGYAKAIAEVADATKEDVNRCENAASPEERTTFCGKARAHCDVIHNTANDLANAK